MKGHKPVYSFTKIVNGCAIDVFPCECGVVGYRPGGTEQEPIRDPKRFAQDRFATCEGKRNAAKRRRIFSE